MSTRELTTADRFAAHGPHTCPDCDVLRAELETLKAQFRRFEKVISTVRVFTKQEN